LFGDDPQHRRTPRRETARAIPLGNTGVVAVVVGDRHPLRDEMKAPMLSGVTAVDRTPRAGSPKRQRSNESENPLVVDSQPSPNDMPIRKMPSTCTPSKVAVKHAM